MGYISGTSQHLLILLEEAFEAGYNAGSLDNFSTFEEDWEDYKAENLEEYVEENNNE